MTGNQHTPSRPAVLVCGAGRSGTSLVTRLLNILGLEVCVQADLLPVNEHNPKGYWESQTVVYANELLLWLAGGSSFIAPDQTEIARLASHEEMGRALQRAFDAVHPGSQVVCKDPRFSWTLPCWTSALGAKPIVVTPLRHPALVIDSWARAVHLPAEIGFAVWEQSIRGSIHYSATCPALVYDLDVMLADPVGWCESVRPFLEASGFRPPQAGWQDHVRSFFEPAMIHQRRKQHKLPREHYRLWDALQGLVGIHPDGITTALPPQSRMTTVLAKRRVPTTRLPRPGDVGLPTSLEESLIAQDLYAHASRCQPATPAATS